VVNPLNRDIIIDWWGIVAIFITLVSLNLLVNRSKIAPILPYLAYIAARVSKRILYSCTLMTF
jgi:hypothetical protein